MLDGVGHLFDRHLQLIDAVRSCHCAAVGVGHQFGLAGCGAQAVVHMVGRTVQPVVWQLVGTEDYRVFVVEGRIDNQVQLPGVVAPAWYFFRVLVRSGGAQQDSGVVVRSPFVRQFVVGYLRRVAHEEGRVEMHEYFLDTVATVDRREYSHYRVIVVIELAVVLDCRSVVAVIQVTDDCVAVARPYVQVQREDGIYFLFAGCPYGIYVCTASP